MPHIHNSQFEGQESGHVPGHNPPTIPTNPTAPYAPSAPPSQSQWLKQPDREGARKDELGKLLEIVESERQGWIVSAQAAAVVAALLCGVEASLLTLVKTDPSNTSSLLPESAFRLLLSMSYLALVFNASSTIASLVMLDYLGEIPMLVAKAARKAADKERLIQESQEVDSMDDYLGLFKVGSRWNWARRYCIGSLVLGSSCIFIQVVTYTWIYEAHSVAAIVTVACAFGSVPLFMLFFS
ncbi:hypothetical protein FRB95_014676 [Tulasnella sp. JGI-2019a]|nr:hypothetical protein FRB95_014676 [Tulasnella sp. JGI-2019a]